MISIWNEQVFSYAENVIKLEPILCIYITIFMNKTHFAFFLCKSFDIIKCQSYSTRLNTDMVLFKHFLI